MHAYLTTVGTGEEVLIGAQARAVSEGCQTAVVDAAERSQDFMTS